MTTFMVYMQITYRIHMKTNMIFLKKISETFFREYLKTSFFCEEHSYELLGVCLQIQHKRKAFANPASGSQTHKKPQECIRSSNFTGQVLRTSPLHVQTF